MKCRLARGSRATCYMAVVVSLPRVEGDNGVQECGRGYGLLSRGKRMAYYSVALAPSEHKSTDLNDMTQ